MNTSSKLPALLTGTSFTSTSSPGIIGKDFITPGRRAIPSRRAISTAQNNNSEEIYTVQEITMKITGNTENIDDFKRAQIVS